MGSATVNQEKSILIYDIYIIEIDNEDKESVYRRDGGVSMEVFDEKYLMIMKIGR